MLTSSDPPLISCGEGKVRCGHAFQFYCSGSVLRLYFFLHNVCSALSVVVAAFFLADSGLVITLDLSWDLQGEHVASTVSLPPMLLEQVDKIAMSVSQHCVAFVCW